MDVVDKMIQYSVQETLQVQVSAETNEQLTMLNLRFQGRLRDLHYEQYDVLTPNCREFPIYYTLRMRAYPVRSVIARVSQLWFPRLWTKSSQFRVTFEEDW